MHDGRLARLADVIEFYDRGGSANPYLDREIRPLNLTEEERAALVTFLRTLSGTVQEGALLTPAQETSVNRHDNGRQ